MAACSTTSPEAAAAAQVVPASWQGTDRALPVTLSEAAASHIAKFIAKRGKGIGIRLGVRTSGCSGMAYKLEFADAPNPEDIEFVSHGVTVLVDPRSLPYLAGTELDYTREGLNEGFKFNNPNVKDACGCGESFNV
jgi:iron-sulfur cluster assembly protein